MIALVPTGSSTWPTFACSMWGGYRRHTGPELDAGGMLGLGVGIGMGLEVRVGVRGRDRDGARVEVRVRA